MAIRFLNTTTRSLCSVYDANPRYAILSHTWETNEEVSFQEMIEINLIPQHLAARKFGYRKIIEGCAKAKAHNLQYLWVDTCCIDKSSSSELSEAINAMYYWYKEAEICYVFLSDLQTGHAPLRDTLGACRWFTRGWCLQELLAPHLLEFFDSEWNYIGSEVDLAPLISTITLIEEEVLLDSSRIGSVPIGRRLSWAARRQTTRAEDMAYCLLGILDINMPLLYGERERAFVRLQEEIVKVSNDHSIFVFGASPSENHIVRPPHTENVPDLEWCELFASSLRDFVGCEPLQHTMLDSQSNAVYEMTNKGLFFRQAELLVDNIHGLYIMSLNCGHSNSEPEYMYLRKTGPSLYYRVKGGPRSNEFGAMDVEEWKKYHDRVHEGVYIAKSMTPALQRQIQRANEYSIVVRSSGHNWCHALQVFQRAPTSNRWDASRMRFLTTGEATFRGYWKVFPNLARKLVEGSDARGQGINKATSSCAYLVCGLDILSQSTAPQAWVRIFSSSQWREIEMQSGTNLNSMIEPKSTRWTEDTLRMASSATRLTIIRASIDLEVGGVHPLFVLHLEIERI
jgi:hypothetical protein